MGKKGNIGNSPSSYAEQLDEEPKPQDNQGGYADNLYEDENKDQSDNPGAREEEQIGSQNSADGSAGADHGDGGIRIGKNLGRPCGEPANQIKEKEAEMTESIFYVVPKNPQIKHVAEKVQESAMKKHGGK